MRLRTLAGMSVFWVGLSFLGDAFTTVILAQRVASLAEPTQVATTLGLIAFVGLLAGMAVQPVAGAISDRLRPGWRRRPLLALGAAVAVGGLAAFAEADSLLAVAAIFVVIQVAASSAQAGQQALVPDLVERRWRGRAAGLKGFADVGGAFVGFTVLALVVGPDLRPAIAAVAAGVAVTAIIALLLVRESREPVPAAPRAGPLGVAVRPFALVVGARFVFLLATFVVGRFLLLFVADRLGLPPERAGAEAAGVLAILTLVTAVAAIPAGWLADRLGRRRVMVSGGLLSAVAALVLLGAGSMEGILLGGALMSLGSAAFVTANWAVTTDLVPPAAAARLMGVANVGTAGAAAAAGLFGFVLDATRGLAAGGGFGALFLMALALFLASAGLAAAVPPSTRRLGESATIVSEADRA